MRMAMAAELEEMPTPGRNPNQCADQSRNQIQFDYDAYAEVEKWWMGSGRERIEAIASERYNHTGQLTGQDDGEERVVNENVLPTTSISLFLSVDF